MLSKRLKATRKRNNLTQEELAIKLKTTKGTISNYENRHSTPSNEMLVDLANALGVTTDYLLGKTDKPDGKHDGGISTAFHAFDELTDEEKEYLETQLEIYRKIKEGKK
jgi:transcriptional regulator with XRE-family HTH domain